MSKIIYQKNNAVTGHNPNDPTWKVWSVNDEYYDRLMAGERPKDWSMLVLPDFDRFIERTANTQLWVHISTYTPIQAGMLFTALTARTPMINLIQGFMVQIVSALGSDFALHSTASSATKPDPNDPEALPIPVGTLADELDLLLSECYFGFNYSDLLGA